MTLLGIDSHTFFIVHHLYILSILHFKCEHKKFDDCARNYKRCIYKVYINKCERVIIDFYFMSQGYIQWQSHILFPGMPIHKITYIF